jgi:hypothetical protein
VLGAEPTPTRPRASSHDTLAQPEGTRLGGVFSPAQSAAPPAPARPPAAMADEGPSTAATWTSTTSRGLSAPLIGVIAGVVLAVAIALIATIVKVSDRGNASEAAAVSGVEAPRAVLEPAEPAAPPPVESAPPPEPSGFEPPPRGTAEPPSTAAKPRASSPPAPVKKRPCEPWYYDADGHKQFRRECL